MKDVGQYSSFYIINEHLSSEKMLNWMQNKKIKVELFSAVIL